MPCLPQRSSFGSPPSRLTAATAWPCSLQETTHVTVDKYKATKPDVVMQGSRAILEWMNESKRAIYLKLFCQEYAQVKS